MKNTSVALFQNLVSFTWISDRLSSRYAILKNKNLFLPPGTAPCCPAAAGSKNANLSSEKSPHGSDFAEFLDPNSQNEINFPDLGDFSDLPLMPPETYHSDTDPFNLSTAETDQPLHSSSAPFAGTPFDRPSHPLDGKPSSSYDTCKWKVDALGQETRVTATELAEERQELRSSHALTSEGFESHPAPFRQLRKDPMQIDYQPDAEPADSSISGDSSSRSAEGGRTTITIDNIASEILVEVIQVLINAKAKFRFETG